MTIYEAIREILLFDRVMTNGETDYWYYKHTTDAGKIRVLKAKPDHHPERNGQKWAYSGFSPFWVSEEELTATWYEYETN